MKKHYFLGSGASYSKEFRQKMRKTRGTNEDSVKLRKFFEEEYGAEQVLLLRNGRSAIAGALKMYEDDNRKEVVVNGFTCYAVVQGVKKAGFKPVFADISRKTLNFDLETLEKVVTENTRAIIVQNTLGNMIDIKEIERFCKKHNLVLIEDLAHSVGRFYPDGREAGKVGEVAIFSFGKEKSIDTVTGGAAIFRNPKMILAPIPLDEPPKDEIKRARLYPTISMIYRVLSYIHLNGVFMRIMLKCDLVRRSADGKVDYNNIHLANFQAKLALEQLKRKKKLAKRPLREFYLVENRDELLQKLAKNGYYFSGFWYEKPVSPERYYKKVHFKEKECPNAVYASEHIINLPTCYPKRDLIPAKTIIQQYLGEDE